MVELNLLKRQRCTSSSSESRVVQVSPAAAPQRRAPLPRSHSDASHGLTNPDFGSEYKRYQYSHSGTPLVLSARDELISFEKRRDLHTSGGLDALQQARRLRVKSRATRTTKSRRAA